MILGKAGEELVEATLVLPTTILILIFVMCWMVTMVSDFINQIKEHEEGRTKIYETREVVILRLREGLDLIEGEVGAD